jgi:hypothetical protein
MMSSTGATPRAGRSGVFGAASLAVCAAAIAAAVFGGTVGGSVGGSVGPHLASRAPTPTLREAQPVRPWPEGIFEDGEAPTSGINFLGTNRWVGTVDGQTYAVHAGRAGSEEDASIGRVFVLRQGTGTTQPVGYFRDLAGVGALRVTAAEGSLITLVDAAGGRHVFDLAAEAFTG